MGCVPTARVEVVYCATPAESGTAAKKEPPSEKVILPAGVPPVDETVAVKVICEPALEGLLELKSDVVVGMTVTLCVPTSVTGAKVVSPGQMAPIACIHSLTFVATHRYNV